MDSLQLVEYDQTYFVLSKEWLYDSELNYLIHAGELPSDEERNRWFASLTDRKDYFIWGVEYNGFPIGACGLKKIEDGTAEFWGYIGEKALWGKGIGKLIIDEVFKKARSLGLSLIWLRVRKYNPRAISLYKRKGFMIEKEELETYVMSLFLQSDHE